MKNAMDRCNFAIAMAAIWTIVFAIMMLCFVKWGSIFAAICMVFSYFKVVSYAHHAGFYEANAKMHGLMETVADRMMEKGRLSKDVCRKSTGNDQTEPIHKADYD